MFVCVVFTAWGAAYVKKSGLLEPYPEPQYLTAEEAAQRPVYSQLTEKEKAVYTALYRGICAQDTEIPLPYEVENRVYSKLYFLLEKQESSLFYIDSTYYTAEKLRTAKIIMRNEDELGYAVMAEKLERRADEILSGLPENADDYDKALWIHDSIIKECTYEIGTDGYNATAYGCLAEGKAHCEGYAKAFDYLAKKAGLQSIVVTGTTDDGSNHAWNQVKINGSWYNADVTWDDSDIENYENYAYFLCNDDDFSETHLADNEYFTPFECKSDADNYYVRNNLLADSLDIAEEILRREIAADAEKVKLKFTDSTIYTDFRDEYIEGEEIFGIIMDYKAVKAGESISIRLRENEKELCMTIYLS